MITIKGRFIGGAEIRANLRELPKAVQGRVLLSAVRAEGQALADEMALAAPRAEGLPDLSDSLGTTTIVSTPSSARVAVGPRRGSGALQHWYLWLFHEFGTSKMAARPFIRPVWDQRGDAAMRSILEALWQRIQSRMRQLKKAAAR